MHGCDEMHTIFWLQNLKGRGQCEDLGIDGKISEQILVETGWEGVDWMHLSQDRDWLQALVNTVQPLGSIKCRGFLD